jgi:hypothetical protein
LPLHWSTNTGTVLGGQDSWFIIAVNTQDRLNFID